VVGIFTNALLLYCIRRHTRKSLGAYKQLLTVFASVDLFLTILHLTMDPRNGCEDGPYLLTLIVFDVVIVISFSMAATLCSLTLIHIRATSKLSLTKKSIELRLLASVSAQTLVPFLFVYIPYFCCLNLPYLSLPVGLLADHCMLLISCFPVWDAVVVLVLMTDYRRAIISSFSRKFMVIDVRPSETATSFYFTAA
ncbi:hypothetical protein PMAYCL1PPCAC_16336, partial [Pristionchus mayeri]